MSPQLEPNNNLSQRRRLHSVTQVTKSRPTKKTLTSRWEGNGDDPTKRLLTQREKNRLEDHIVATPCTMHH